MALISLNNQVFLFYEKIYLTGLASRLAISLKAPGTPAGNCRKKESPLEAGRRGGDEFSIDLPGHFEHPTNVGDLL